MTHTTLLSPPSASIDTEHEIAVPASASADRTRTIEVYAGTSAEPAAVWRLLADARTWTTWAGFDEATYEVPGSQSPDGIGAVRAFRAGPLRSRETVLVFEPDRHLAYDYVGSLPYRWYRGDVTLMVRPAGTQIRWRAEFQPRRRLTGPVLQTFMTIVLRRIVHRLAHAAAATPSGPTQ